MSENTMTLRCLECDSMANPSFGTFVPNIVGLLQFQCKCGYVLTLQTGASLLTDDPIKRLMETKPSDEEILDRVKLKYWGKHHGKSAPQQE